jgi:hypothetical protein
MQVEKLIAHAGVERFNPGVLGWLTRIDKVQLDVVLDRPFHHGTSGIFGAIVHSYTSRVAAHFSHFVERTNHPSTRQRTIDVEGQPFAAEPVFKRQDTHLWSGPEPVFHKVQPPFVIELHRRWRHRPTNEPYPPPFARLHLQLFLGVDAPQAFVIHHDAVAAQEDLEHAPAGAQSLRGKHPQTLAHGLIAIDPLRAVLGRAPRAFDDATGLPMAHAIQLQGPHRLFAR